MKSFPEFSVAFVLKADAAGFFSDFFRKFIYVSGKTADTITNPVQLLTDNDMMYVDWNVSPEEAAGNHLPVKKIAADICPGLKKDRSNIVLMHGISAKQTAADAPQSMIPYGRRNGYGFYPVTADTVLSIRKL